MGQADAQAEEEETPGQSQQGSLQLWDEFTHKLREGNTRTESARVRRSHGSSLRTA